jgi:hypothetical protein
MKLPIARNNIIVLHTLEEAVKLLEDLVSRIEPVSRSHATSPARSSVGFGAAALPSRDLEKGVKALHDAVGADTRRFVQSQGPEFHSLVAQVSKLCRSSMATTPQILWGCLIRGVKIFMVWMF